MWWTVVLVFCYKVRWQADHPNAVCALLQAHRFRAQDGVGSGGMGSSPCWSLSIGSFGHRMGQGQQEWGLHPLGLCFMGLCGTGWSRVGEGVSGHVLSVWRELLGSHHATGQDKREEREHLSSMFVCGMLIFSVSSVCLDMIASKSAVTQQDAGSAPAPGDF